MKITRQHLRRIIQSEIKNALHEAAKETAFPSTDVGISTPTGEDGGESDTERDTQVAMVKTSGDESTEKSSTDADSSAQSSERAAQATSDRVKQSELQAKQDKLTEIFQPSLGRQLRTRFADQAAREDWINQNIDISTTNYIVDPDKMKGGDLTLFKSIGGARPALGVALVALANSRGDRTSCCFAPGSRGGTTENALQVENKICCCFGPWGINVCIGDSGSKFLQHAGLGPTADNDAKVAALKNKAKQTAWIAQYAVATFGNLAGGNKNTLTAANINSWISNLVSVLGDPDAAQGWASGAASEAYKLVGIPTDEEEVEGTGEAAEVTQEHLEEYFHRFIKDLVTG